MGFNQKDDKGIIMQCESIFKLHAINWDSQERKWLELQCSDQKGHTGNHSYEFTDPQPLTKRDNKSVIWKDGAKCECSECRA